MTDKQIIDVTKCIHFDKSDIPNGCTCYWDGECNHDCYYKQLQREKQNSQEAIDASIREFNRAEELKTLLKRKEQEYEELRQYHNKCCEEFENEKQKLIDKYNQFSKDFFIGKYCKKEYCELLKAKEQECEKYKQTLAKIKRDYTF